MSYPVQFAVSQPRRFTRVQLLIRIAALSALGILGVSVGSLLAVAYLVLPVYAAIRTASFGSNERYVSEDGPRLLRVLSWFAALSAWAGLATEQLPARSPDETVLLSVDGPPAVAPPSSLLLRLVTGLPSALVLMLLGSLGSLVWLWAAISIVFTEGMSTAIRGYLVGIQRWSLRLLAYQAGLVDQYPPFSFHEDTDQLPQAKPMAS